MKIDVSEYFITLVAIVPHDCLNLFLELYSSSTLLMVIDEQVLNQLPLP